MESRSNNDIEVERMNQITQTKLWEMYIDSAKHAFERGEEKVAEEILTSALKELCEIIDTRKLILIEVQRTLANIYSRASRYSEAEPLYKWAIAMAEANFGRGHANIIPVLEDLAASYERQGRLDEEERIRIQIAEIGRRSGGSSAERDDNSSSVQSLAS